MATTIRTGRDELILRKVWEAPVRLSHWVMAFSIVVLWITGYLIGNPRFSAPGDAATLFEFGTIRFLHFAAGYLLLAAFLLRLYWGFVGNRYARWWHMLPLRGWQWRAMAEEIRDLLYPRGRFRVYTGHSPLANVIYVFVYLAVAFALLTGFTMYAAAQYTPFWRAIAAWGLGLFGGNLNQVHFLHHWLLWLFGVFIVVHLYLVVYTVILSRTTEVDTMISGYKFVLKSELSELEETGE